MAGACHSQRSAAIQTFRWTLRGDTATGTTVVVIIRIFITTPEKHASRFGRQHAKTLCAQKLWTGNALGRHRARHFLIETDGCAKELYFLAGHGPAIAINIIRFIVCHDYCFIFDFWLGLTALLYLHRELLNTFISIRFGFLYDMFIWFNWVMARIDSCQARDLISAQIGAPINCLFHRRFNRPFLFGLVDLIVLDQ